MRPETFKFYTIEQYTMFADLLRFYGIPHRYNYASLEILVFAYPITMDWVLAEYYHVTR